MSHNFATCPELWLQTSYHKASIREWFFELSYVFATCPELARDKKTRSSFTPRKARDKLHLCVIFCAACLKNTMRNYNRNDFALTARDKLHLCVIFCVRGCCQRFTAWGMRHKIPGRYVVLCCTQGLINEYSHERTEARAHEHTCIFPLPKSHLLRSIAC